MCLHPKAQISRKHITCTWSTRSSVRNGLGLRFWLYLYTYIIYREACFCSLLNWVSMGRNDVCICLSASVLYCARNISSRMVVHVLTDIWVLTPSQPWRAKPNFFSAILQVKIWFNYLFIEGLEPSQPHRVTSGLFTNSNLAQVEYNTKHAHYINVKHTNIIRKLVPSVSLL